MSKRKSYSTDVNAAVGSIDNGSSKKKMVTTTENDKKSEKIMERMKQLESNALTISLTNERLLKENQMLKTNNFQLNQQIINLNNIEIDGNNNQQVNKILNQIILKDTVLKNKIYFKNLINNAIKFYAG